MLYKLIKSAYLHLLWVKEADSLLSQLLVAMQHEDTSGYSLVLDKLTLLSVG